MITLGICNGETSSACIFRDGKLTAAASEERFTRIKMDDTFPNHAIDFVLQFNGLALKDVEQVAYAWAKGFDASLLNNYVRRGAQISSHGREALEIFIERIDVELERDEGKKNEFWEWASKHLPKHLLTSVKVFNHHESHAFSAALLSPFENALVVTCDGRGDFEALTCWIYNEKANPVLRKIFSSNSSDSLGFFYGRITGLLGYTPCRHEGKITGLAAHGNPDVAISLMQEMIDFVDGEIRAQLGPLYRPFYTNYSDELVERIKQHSPEDIAAAAQQHLETLLSKVVLNCLSKENLSSAPLVVAGGVFGNVRANQTLKELPSIQALFVQPQMGDGGLCLGAAAAAQHSSGQTIAPLKNMYLGPAVDPDALWNNRSSYELNSISQIDNVEEEILLALSKDKLVGLVRGRMEFGPRALAHRTVLFKTSDKAANDWLNQRLKRTEFMPFAPVITEEAARECFVEFDPNDHTVRHMTSTLNCHEQFISACPAVVHIDGTARPQIITREGDPFLWNILTEWHKKTGEFSLINTSFNSHEEPIVCTVDDAIDSLNSGVIDVLFIENLKITNRDPDNSCLTTSIVT